MIKVALQSSAATGPKLPFTNWPRCCGRSPLCSHSLQTQSLGQAEPLLQRAFGVVHRRAPGARGLVAVGVAQLPNNQRHLRKRGPDPRRHDRFPARDRDPRQGIGHRPSHPRIIERIERRTDLLTASLTLQYIADRSQSCGMVRRARVADVLKDCIKSVGAIRARDKVMPRQKQIAGDCPFRASIWLLKTSNTRRASSSGSFTCPACSRPS